jgi:ketosteroid isomerase-like protein
MQYTHLGRTGLQVSRLGLGTMNFGELTDETTSFEIMDKALDVGINYYPYGSRMFPEKMVGKQEVYENWKGVPELYESLSFSIHEIYVDVTKQTAIVRFDTHHIMKGGTRRYDNTLVCIFIYNEEGTIKEYYEYFNSITTGVAHGLL